MSYRKITVRSHLSNSQPNMIVRQKFAQKFLELLESDIELFSVDQSAVVSMHPTKRGWFKPWDSGNVFGRHLSKRVNLTVAVSSKGRLFYSMHQEKNNGVAAVLFLSNLFKLLEEQD